MTYIEQGGFLVGFLILKQVNVSRPLLWIEDEELKILYSEYIRSRCLFCLKSSPGALFCTIFGFRNYKIIHHLSRVQSVAGKLAAVGEIPLDKPRFSSTLVSSYRGLIVIGGKKTPTTAILRFFNIWPHYLLTKLSPHKILFSRQGRFQEGPRLPIPIAEAGSCEINRNIYVIGKFYDLLRIY